MNIIKYTDNDAINKPQTGSAPVHALEDTGWDAVQAGMTKENLVEKFPKVFAEEVGQLEGEYHIKPDATISPVQHAPHRVPVALRVRLKAELEEMEQQGIIASVTTPTAWGSSIVVVSKKNGKLRICLEPKELNQQSSGNTTLFLLSRTSLRAYMGPKSLRSLTSETVSGT